MPTITANGVTLNYRLDGPEGAPVIAFSNSLGTTLAMWDRQAEALSASFRCLRYDTRGHGGSQTADAPFSVGDLADDLAALLTALGIAKAHVVGLSLGGMTGQALAVRHPETVDRLVLVATAPYLPPADLWLDRAAIVREKGLGAIVDNIIGRWFTPPEHGSAGAAATKADILERVDPEGYAACCEAIAGMDLRGTIGAIRAPTLVISGSDDPATPPAMGEEIASHIPGAKFAVVTEAAHLIAVERPDAITRHIADFLGAASPATHADRRPTRPPADTAAAFAAGLANRRHVLGAEHVDRSLKNAGEFGTPWQDFITRYAWGEVWGDDTIPWKTRSMVTLSLMVALGREEEFKLHVRPALKNGVTIAELCALLKQCAVYAGVPAANGAMKWVRDVLGDELE